MSEELDDIFEMDNTEETAIDRLSAQQRNRVSFDSEVVKSKPTTKYIRKETVIDKYCIKRERVVLSPTMCDKPHCHFDIAKQNGLNWNKLSEEKKEEILDALEEHKRVVHSISEDIIIEASDLPTDWLGKKQKSF